ncbi:hypothetical protein BUALT_Bualt02G0055700 [Buddleja alternifolia]|uniref:Malectin-like domain-containing protein n=1 Tax=Buddleja alternifolia TaxID=168488 RepID=A0AAV6Y4T4_9LAMI|nr:hypothetical protein BUALT_Bualt02G0055700 [Buddleja alternifolia]
MDSHLPFLVLALCILSASADVFVSIDCGSSDIHTDENLIIWSGDNIYIQNGESRVVQNSNSISPIMDTLRVFTTRKKNCYFIEAKKGERVIVRASFYYGNYDQKSSPPSFDLQFDGNHWVTVETSNTEYVYYEIIYVVKGDSISVCVAQTKPGQFPFISALEVRSVDLSMYSNVDQDYPLHLIRRVAYGTNETVRYVDDRYDRIWTPVVGGNGLTNVASDAIFIDTSAWDQPPPAVLRNAITGSSPSTRIQLLKGFSSGDVPIYLNMYFSEVTQLDSTERRSFQVLVDSEPLLDHPIIPTYSNFTELYASNFTVSSNTTITLVPTSDSSLPPLINAMEVFLIGDVMTDGTNNNDGTTCSLLISNEYFTINIFVSRICCQYKLAMNFALLQVEGLASLKSTFDVLQDWGGDPCLPAPYSWDWINCSSDPTPRITALYLSSFGLSGPLPDFSSMDALETIDFHNNSLNGPIPEFLATLPNLKQLNLASNQFSGPIPDSLSNKNGLNLVVTSNPELCTSGNSCETTNSARNNPGGVGSSGYNNKKKKSKVPVIVGTTVPTFVIIWAVLGVMTLLHYRKKRATVAASTSGQGGANRPQSSSSSPINTEMIGKMGKAFMDEIKVNMEDQASNVDISDYQINQQPNGTN